MKRLLVILALAAASTLAACSSDHSYRRGVQAFEKGAWQKSIRHFELVSGWHDRYTDAQQRIGRAYFNLGKEKLAAKQWKDAIVYLGKVQREDVDYAEARALIGDVNYYRGKDAFERGDWKDAIWHLNIVRSSNSHYREARDLVRAAKEAQQALVASAP